MFESTIHSIMTTGIISLPLGAFLKDALSLMSKNNISCVVIEGDHKPLGILTERDIIKIAARKRDIAGIKVEEVMNSPVKTVSKDLDVYEAAVYMEKNHFRRIVIVNENGEMLGLVTQTDLKNHMGAVYYLKLKTVASIMTQRVITAKPDEPLHVLVQKMNQHNISCLVVCRHNKPVGIITERDITHLMADRENPFNILARDMVKLPLVYVFPHTSVYEAVNLMKQKNIRRLVVMDERKKLAGLITEPDIIRNLEPGSLDILHNVVERDRIYINSIREGLFECNSGVDGAFTWMNPYGAKIFGYKSLGKIIGHLKLRDIFVNPQELAGLMAIVENNGTVNNFNTVLKRYRGKQFCAEITLCSVRDEYNKTTYIEGTIRDVTDHKKMQDRLARYSAKLEQKVKERTAEIRKKNKELEKMNARLQEIAVKDSLTGLHNFRYLSQVLESEFKRANRYNVPLYCIILDIDDFKFINDHFGHLNGDFALKKTARLLEKAIRDTDVVARYGGDEFTIVLPNTDLNGACSVGSKILERFRSYYLNNEGVKLGKISLSLGISSLPNENIKTHVQLLEYADKAMYRAKENGKNNICTCHELV